MNNNFDESAQNSADERFRRSLGYTGDNGFENAQQTNQFQAQNQSYQENSSGNARFQKSLGYSEQAAPGVMQFQRQSGSQYDVPLDARTQRSMNYGGAVQSNGYADYERQAPAPVVNDIVEEKPEFAVTAVNKPRRFFKKLTRFILKLLRILCTTSPLTVMVLYAKPLALISKETHVRLFYAAIVVLFLANVVDIIFEAATHSVKTAGRVVSYESKNRLVNDGGSISTEKVYRSRVLFSYNGQEYLSEVDIEKEPQIGQTVQLRADPKDLSDASLPQGVIKPIIRTVAETASLVVIVYVIFGWEAGRITNFNADAD